MIICVALIGAPDICARSAELLRELEHCRAFGRYWVRTENILIEEADRYYELFSDLCREIGKINTRVWFTSNTSVSRWYDPRQLEDRENRFLERIVEVRVENEDDIRHCIFRAQNVCDAYTPQHSFPWCQKCYRVRSDHTASVDADVSRAIMVSSETTVALRELNGALPKVDVEKDGMLLNVCLRYGTDEEKARTKSLFYDVKSLLDDFNMIVAACDYIPGYTPGTADAARKVQSAYKLLMENCNSRVQPLYVPEGDRMVLNPEFIDEVKAKKIKD